jgi:hypothetical protein
MKKIQSRNYILIAIGLLLTNFIQAQCNSWEAHPQNVQTAKEQHQVYRDLLSSGKYAEAFSIWQKLFLEVKSPKEAPSRHFKDGIKFYKEFAKAAIGKEKKEAYIDTIISLYSQMAACVGEKSLDRAWMGYNIYSLKGQPENAITAFEKSLDLGGNETHNMVIVPITQLSVYLYQKRHPKISKEYLTKLYYRLKKIADYNIDKNPSDASKYTSKWEKAYNEFYKLRDSLPGIWDCSYYEKRSEAKYLSDSNNIEKNQVILKLIETKCGVLSDFYKKVKQHQDFILANTCNGVWLQELSLFKQATCLESKSIFFMKRGDSFLSDGYMKKAMNLYQDVLSDKDTTISDYDKATLCYRFAYMAYREKNFVKARSLCRKASKYRPNWGEPYLLVGTMYASSSKECSNGNRTSLEAKSVIWVAMDEWETAQRIDTLVHETVKKQLKKYRKYLPRIEDVFVYSLNPKDKYTVGCWIQQETEIRAKQE